MIRTENDGMVVGGSKFEILNELANLINCLMYQINIPEKDIDFAVKLGKMTDEEREKSRDDTISKMAMMALMGAMFKNIAEECDDQD